MTKGAGKAALAVAPKRPVPTAVAARAKTGFHVPIGAWFGQAPNRSAAKLDASRGWALQVLRPQLGKA
jgi:hypothetical protein